MEKDARLFWGLEKDARPLSLCYTESMKSLPTRGHVESISDKSGRFRARETMEQKGYNPIERLIALDKKLEDDASVEAIKIQMDIAKKLLEYFAEKPPSQHQLSLTQSQHVIIRPAEFLDPEYLGLDGPSQPEVLDILGEEMEHPRNWLENPQDKATDDEGDSEDGDQVSVDIN